MPHGHPDYGISAATETVYALPDLGELAARLGSIVTFDRRGNIIWLDDFEDNINHWAILIGGTGTSVALSEEAARNRKYSAKMVTGDTIGNSPLIYKAFPLPSLSKIGFEISYAMYLNIKYLYLRLFFYERNAQYHFALRYDRYNTTLAYLNSSGDYTDLPGIISHQMLFHSWNTIKLVADYENKKYVRALLNENTFDLSNIAPYSPAYTGTPYLYLGVSIENRATGNHYIYLDDAILTQNEP